jgi:hypothetical protein
MPVSFSINSRGANPELEQQFFYTVKECKPSKKFTDGYSFLTGLVALSAVIITLMDIGHTRKVPKKVFVV